MNSKVIVSLNYPTQGQRRTAVGCHSVRGRVYPGQVLSSSQGCLRDRHSHTLTKHLLNMRWNVTLAWLWVWIVWCGLFAKFPTMTCIADEVSPLFPQIGMSPCGMSWVPGARLPTAWQNLHTWYGWFWQCVSLQTQQLLTRSSYSLQVLCAVFRECCWHYICLHSSAVFSGWLVLRVQGLEWCGAYASSNFASL